MKEYDERIPTAVFGVVALVAGLLVTFLPETSNTPLPDTIQVNKGGAGQGPLFYLTREGGGKLCYKLNNNGQSRASLLCPNSYFSLYKCQSESPLKGTDRLCKEVKLSMQCCGQILQDSFET